MEYEDRLRLRTPEGVDLELVLAGMGSRMIAGIFDFTTQGLLALAYFLGASAVGLDGGLMAAGWAITGFLLLFGYDVGFEVLAHGRTPGKRLTGLRVMRSGGQPINFVTSSIRNVLRLVDILPMAYGIGVLVMMVTKRNQRLGDLIAGTVVVRERMGGRGDQGGETVEVQELVRRHEELASRIDVSAITAEEVATVRRFLDRRSSLEPDAAEQLAYDLTARLAPRVGGVPPGTQPDGLLELVVAAKALRGG